MEADADPNANTDAEVDDEEGSGNMEKEGSVLLLKLSGCIALKCRRCLYTNYINNSGDNGVFMFALATQKAVRIH